MGMVQPGNGAGFGEVLFGVFASGQLRTGWNLDRNLSLQFFVVSQVNQTEGAFSEYFVEAIASAGGRLLALNANVIAGRQRDLWPVVPGLA